MRLNITSFTALGLTARLAWAAAAISVLWLSIYLALR